MEEIGVWSIPFTKLRNKLCGRRQERRLKITAFAKHSEGATTLQTMSLVL